MKLRNKKTGEIEPYVELIVNQSFGRTKEYSTLKEFCEEWEDYTPQEPLIKDKNYRKAVRAWADINCINEVQYAENNDKSLCVLTDFSDEFDYTIEFVGWIPTLKDSETYTITELCGEEE